MKNTIKNKYVSIVKYNSKLLILLIIKISVQRELNIVNIVN